MCILCEYNTIQYTTYIGHTPKDNCDSYHLDNNQNVTLLNTHTHTGIYIGSHLMYAQYCAQTIGLRAIGTKTLPMERNIYIFKHNILICENITHILQLCSERKRIILWYQGVYILQRTKPSNTPINELYAFNSYKTLFTLADLFWIHIWLLVVVVAAVAILFVVVVGFVCVCVCVLWILSIVVDNRHNWIKILVDRN